MSFELKPYRKPDFNEKKFIEAPDVKIVCVEKDGVVPDDFHATSIFPEYFKVNGEWLCATQSRMDCVPVLEEGKILSKEARSVKKGDKVIIGRSEDCEDGIYVHNNGFADNTSAVDPFAFRKNRSRETSFSKEYDEICELLKYERDNGNILWVLGPALSFDRNARDAFAALVNNGYVDGVCAGNALATHDLEAAYLHTALGQNIYTQENVHNGHYHHLETINKVRGDGSIKEFIKNKNIDNGIMWALEKNDIPYVLAGSIRDDGPLPEVTGNVYEAQDRMRKLTDQATTVICLATMLHTIAIGNMTPSYRVMKDGNIRQIYFYVVDISEFMVNKLADRGSLSSRSIITNVQDFVAKVGKGLEVY
ncbi:MAG: hypothetical protein IK151_01735 [Erysipelotrichaceae bacterium]|nr:hypothetical protein [Erysipelotrichaceae bacterium]